MAGALPLIEIDFPPAPGYWVLKSALSLPYQPFRVFPRVKGNQVLQPLSQAHIEHRKAQFARYGDENAPSSRPVHLGDDQPRYSHSLNELTGLDQRILPCGGIQDQEDLVRCVLDDLCGNVLYLFPLFNCAQV